MSFPFENIILEVGAALKSTHECVPR